MRQHHAKDRCRLTRGRLGVYLPPHSLLPSFPPPVPISLIYLIYIQSLLLRLRGLEGTRGGGTVDLLVWRGQGPLRRGRRGSRPHGQGSLCLFCCFGRHVTRFCLVRAQWFCRCFCFEFLWGLNFLPTPKHGLCCLSSAEARMKNATGSLPSTEIVRFVTYESTFPPSRNIWPTYCLLPTVIRRATSWGPSARGPR